MPDKVRKAAEDAHRARLSGTSLIQDKNATPSEPAQAVAGIETGMRPLNIVAQRSS